jgi:hypothetical protein
VKDYLEFAKSNKINLLDSGRCQFCGANMQKGIHECLEIFNFEIQAIDFSSEENHRYKFLVVDAHALQHAEIHGRWSNHFHLTRLHLIFKYNINWSYELSTKLSSILNKYKRSKEDEYLISPKVLERGSITSVDIIKNQTEEGVKNKIKKWAFEIYMKWKKSHNTVDYIAKEFLKK